MQDEDPSTAFFPDVAPGKLDLYSVLNLSSEASTSDIKSAYRRLALVHHPDKHASSSPEQLEQANKTFQQIGFAYAVLKDETRRKRYDDSGRTDEGSGEGAKTEAEWKDYFKELWQGEVNANTIDDFKKKYQGSDEELDDLYESYTSSKGDLETILSAIMCSSVEDEPRFVDLINEGIKEGKLKSTAAWKKSLKDVKGHQRRKDKANKEATEAEAYAKELGVHDKLYGDGKKSSTKGKGKGKGKDDNDDEAGLRALIQSKQSSRMDAMMESLEAKYGAGAPKKGGKKRSSTGGASDADGEAKSGKKQRKVEVEPTEDEFAKIQAEMDARRAGAKGGKKGK